MFRGDGAFRFDEPMSTVLSARVDEVSRAFSFREKGVGSERQELGDDDLGAATCFGCLFSGSISVEQRVWSWFEVACSSI